MRFASQLTMGFVLSSVVLCGDNVVRNKKYFERDGTVKAMQEAFLDHSAERMGFMSRASMFRQIVELNVNLVGCAYFASHILKTHSKL